MRNTNNGVKKFDQVRESVITAWLKQYDLRKTQYLAGHKYVSSTEDYKANVIDELQEDIRKFLPL
ncbi:MAG: hypothetical protein ACR2KB_12535 [Chitinophagaceae bacterium]